MTKQKKYFTEEERRGATLESYHKAYHKYYSTPNGRAKYLLRKYRQMDRRNGFGDVIDLDAQWIVENIFTKKCAHCDCTDWRELGCNRIDNSKPHTKDNVEPCCWKHNFELAVVEKEIPITQHDRISGELVAVWPSANEAARQLGYSNSHINECCNGKLNSAYGYVWKKINKDDLEEIRILLEGRNSL